MELQILKSFCESDEGLKKEWAALVDAAILYRPHWHAKGVEKEWALSPNPEKEQARLASKQLFDERFKAFKEKLTLEHPDKTDCIPLLHADTIGTLYNY